MQVSAPTRVPSSLGPFPSQMAMGWGESEGFLPKWFHSFSCASTVNPRLGFHRPNGGTPLRRNAPIFEQTISFTGSLQGSVPEIPHGPSPARAVASGPVPQRTAVLRSNFFCSFSCMFFRLGLQPLFEVGVGWPTVCARFLKGSSRFPGAVTAPRWALPSLPPFELNDISSAFANQVKGPVYCCRTFMTETVSGVFLSLELVLPEDFKTSCNAILG